MIWIELRLCSKENKNKANCFNELKTELEFVEVSSDKSHHFMGGQDLYYGNNS